MGSSRIRILLLAVSGVLAGGVLLLVSATTIAASPGTHWVRADGATIVAGGGESCESPGYSTIAAAVDAASAGDTVRVCAGTYVGSVDVGKSLTILGANSAISPIDGTRGAESVISGDGDYAVEIFASDVVLDGFTVTNTAGNAVRVAVGRASGRSLSGVTVRNLIAQGGSVLSCPDCAGLFLGTLSFDNFELADDRASGIVFEDNLITVTQDDGIGVSFSGYNGAQLTGTNRISGNRIVTTGGPLQRAYAVEIRSTSGAGSMNVQVHDNTIGGFARGVFVRGDATVDLQGNVFLVGGVSNQHDVLLTGSAPSVIGAGNAFHGSLSAIWNFADVALDISTSAVGSTFHGITLNAGTSLADLFAIEDRIRHKVDLATYGFVRVRADQVFVTPSSFVSPTTTAPSIQRAVDAATAGDTIHVAAGTYDGTVTVGKTLTLRGPFAGVSPVSGDGSTTVAWSGARATIVGGASGSVITLTGEANGTTIEGFAITSSITAVPTTYGPLGIDGRSPDGITIRNNHFYALYNTAIYNTNTRAGGVRGSGWLITQNLITNPDPFDVNSPYFASERAAINPWSLDGATLSYNRIDGYGRGIQLEANATPVVEHNHLSNIFWHAIQAANSQVDPIIRFNRIERAQLSSVYVEDFGLEYCSGAIRLWAVVTSSGFRVEDNIITDTGGESRGWCPSIAIVGEQNPGSVASITRNQIAGTPSIGIVWSATQVASASLADGVATVVTHRNNPLAVGDTVVVSDLGAPFDGTWIVASKPNVRTFTFARPAADVASFRPGPLDGASAVKVGYGTIPAAGNWWGSAGGPGAPGASINAGGGSIVVQPWCATAACAAQITPSITSLSVTSGTAGDTVTINGSGLLGARAVQFGSAAASFTVVSNDVITAVVPNLGTGVVTVVLPHTTLTSADAFTATSILWVSNDDGATIVAGGGESCESPGYSTIAAAVDAASAGDTVRVCAGTYVGSVDVGKSLTILGANSAISPIDGTRGAESVISGDGDYAVEIFASDVVLDGFTVTNTAGNAVRVAVGRASGRSLSGVTVRNLIAQGGSVLSCPDCAGLFLGTLSFDNFELADDRASGIVFEDNLITVTQDDGIGVSFSGYNGAQLTGTNRISGNRIVTTGGPLQRAYAVEIRSTSGAGSMNVQVHDNTIGGFARGVFVRGDATVDLQGNVFLVGGVSNQHDVLLTGSAPSVIGAGNAFHGSLSAIWNFADVALDISTSAVGSTFHGITLNAGTSLADLFAIEDRIRHKVDLATYGFVRVRADQVFVTPSSFVSPTTTAPSIQRAVDAATAGDTIHVAAGTYDGTVTVGKSLTIKGPFAGVHGTHGSRGGAGEAVLSLAAGGTIVTIGSDGVTLDGLTIVGSENGTTTQAVVNIGVRKDFTVRNTRVIGSNTPPTVLPSEAYGSYKQSGFLVTGTSGDAGRVIERNYIARWHTGFFNQGSSGTTFDDNVFADNRTSISGDSVGTTRYTDNRFERNYTTITFNAAAAGPFVITGNTFVENQFGPNLRSQTNASGISLSANRFLSSSVRFTDAAFAGHVVLWFDGTFNASGNWWGPAGPGSDALVAIDPGAVLHRAPWCSDADCGTTVFGLVTGLSPVLGAPGTTVTLTGKGFQDSAPVSAVSFDGVAATSFQVVSDTTLYAVVPAGTGTGPITLTLNGGTASSASFEAFVPAGLLKVDSFSPLAAAPGSTIRVNGAGFDLLTTVVIAGIPAEFSTIGTTSAVVTVPLGASINGPVTFTTPVDLVTSTTPLTVVVPTISGLSEASRQAGDSLTITGSNLLGVNRVTFGSGAVVSVTPSMIAATGASLTVTVPAGATTGDVVVANRLGAATNTPTLTVTVPLAVDQPGAIPLLGWGDALTVSGTRLGEVTSVTVAQDGGDAPLAAAFTAGPEGTSLTITVPVGSDAGQRTVVISAGDTEVATFTIEVVAPGDPAPTIASGGRNRGAVGATVRVNGTGFLTVVAVEFCGSAGGCTDPATATWIPASVFRTIGTTSIAVVVPEGAVNGRVRVTTFGGTAVSPWSFTVLP
jgi:hypothetical protein